MKEIILGLIALSSITAFADCRIVQTGGTVKKLTLNGLVSLESTQTHLIKNETLLFTAETTVKIQPGSQTASKFEIDRALDIWIVQKEKLAEVATQANCGEDILREISESSFSIGYP